MKELSIEEKAKAYDELIVKAKLMIQERGNEPDGAALLSKLFPHLRESDDERIRKNLIKSLDDILKQNAYMHGTCFKYVNVKEAIAWLEKQGEQKPAWSEEDEIALDDALWCCKQAASIAADENDMGNVWYAKTWLKSIKDRVQTKK